MRPLRFALAFLLALVVVLTPAVARAWEGELTVSAVADRASALPGDQLVVAVIFEHQDGWHSQANEEQFKAAGSTFSAQYTTIKPGDVAATFQLGDIQWPKAEMISGAALGNPMAQIPVFGGTAIAYLPVVVKADAKPGDVTIPVAVRYQVCDDTTCLFPTNLDLSVPISIRTPGSPAPAGGQTPDAATFANFDRSAFAKMLSGQVASTAKPLELNFFGWKYTLNTAGAGLILLLLISLVGGFILNLTPCVLPVIPIKIMSLQHSAGTASRRIMLGSIMSVGVIAFWMVLGLAMAFVKGFTAANQLFQNPYFTLGIGLFVAIMAIGMLGLFTVKLPDWVYAIDPKRESPIGSFLFGVMTAVLATPCIAPFGGAAMAWATKQPVPILLATFATIGLGMSLPYLILALFPQLVAKVPRTGPASELVKQVMGILMLAVAIFFIGSGIDPLTRLPVDPAMLWYWWIVGGLVVLAAVWILVRTFQITRRAAHRCIWSVLALVLVGVGSWIGINLSSHGPIKWVGYTPERLAQAQQEGKIVVMDFTAEWCLNCKALKAGVLFQKPIVQLFDTNQAIPMKVDLTGDNKPGSAKLAELGAVGIPLLATYGPGITDPIKYDTYTVQTVLDAVAKAGGGQTASTSKNSP